MTSAPGIESPDPSPLSVSHPPNIVPYSRLQVPPTDSRASVFSDPYPLVDVIYGRPLSAINFSARNKFPAYLEKNILNLPTGVPGVHTEQRAPIDFAEYHWCMLWDVEVGPSGLAVTAVAAVHRRHAPVQAAILRHTVRLVVRRRLVAAGGRPKLQQRFQYHFPVVHRGWKWRVTVREKINQSMDLN